jgi:DNA-binding GntR family transcriptional regulator
MLQAKDRVARLARRPAAAIKQPPMHELVADRLRDAIVEGKYLPDQIIPELDVCAELGVSRTPVREALKVLAAEGIVELATGRGAVVVRLTRQDATDMFTVLSRLESLAGSLAARHATDSEIEEIRLLHDRMQAAFTAGRKRDYFKLNLAIHERILDAGHNRHLKATWQSYNARVRRMRYLSNIEAADWRRSMREHVAILRALRARDEATLARLLETHVAATLPTALAAHTGEMPG